MDPERSAQHTGELNRTKSRNSPSRRQARWAGLVGLTSLLLTGCALSSPTAATSPATTPETAATSPISTPSPSSAEPSSATPSPAATPSAAGSPSVPKAATLIKAGICGSRGRITGHTYFDHPSWGASIFVTCLDKSDSELHAVAVLDASGKIRWSHKIRDTYYVLTTAKAGTDSTGNLFVKYDPGRYAGIAIFRPVNGSMKRLAGFYDNGNGKEDGRFYNAKLIGPNAAGRYSVRHYVNDCDPSCGTGTTTSKVYTWNGSNYAKK